MPRCYNPKPMRAKAIYIALLATMLIGLLAGCVTGNTEKPLPYLREQGDFFMQSGIVSYSNYNFALATDQFNLALVFYSRFDDYTGTTNALLNLGKTNLARGLYDAAMQNLEKADRLIALHPLQQQAIYRDMLLTNLYITTDRLAAAETIFTRYDLALHGELADDVWLALLINRVQLAQLSGKEFSTWRAVLAQQPNKTTTDLSARLDRFNAWQAYLDNDPVKGEQLFNTAIELYRSHANPTGLMSTQLEWANAYSTIKKWPETSRHYEQALFLAMANNHFNNGVLALDGLRRTYQQSGQPEKLQQVDEWMKQLKSIPQESKAR